MTDHVNLIARLLARCTEVGDCLIWQGRVAHGSPLVHLGGKYLTARRVLWEATHGAIPRGLYPSCICHETACMNIKHIRLMTTQQIAAKAATRGAFSRPERRAAIALAVRRKSNLTPEMLHRIRAADTGAAVARELGISKSLATKIRAGKAWGLTSGASVFNWRP